MSTHPKRPLKTFPDKRLHKAKCFETMNALQIFLVNGGTIGSDGAPCSIIGPGSKFERARMDKDGMVLLDEPEDSGECYGMSAEEFSKGFNCEDWYPVSTHPTHEREIQEIQPKPEFMSDLKKL